MKRRAFVEALMARYDIPDTISPEAAMALDIILGLEGNVTYDRVKQHLRCNDEEWQ